MTIKSKAAELVEKYGKYAYTTAVMDRFMRGEFAIECHADSLAQLLLSAIVDAVDRAGMKVAGEPKLIVLADTPTLYYCTGAEIRSCPESYPRLFVHDKALDTIVPFATIYNQKAFDDESRDLLTQINMLLSEGRGAV